MYPNFIGDDFRPFTANVQYTLNMIENALVSQGIPYEPLEIVIKGNEIIAFRYSVVFHGAWRVMQFIRNTGTIRINGQPVMRGCNILYASSSISFFLGMQMPGSDICYTWRY